MPRRINEATENDERVLSCVGVESLQISTLVDIVIGRSKESVEAGCEHGGRGSAMVRD